ncbi:MAG: hypothetical protein ACWGOD_04640 [Desulfobulbales bacterium]
MSRSDNYITSLDQAGEVLFDFALEREDVKALMAHMPGEAKCKPVTVEYELQILKIVATGWAVSFFLERNPHKAQLAEEFWKRIHAFSGELSKATGLMIGQDINYFQIIRERLDQYIAALQNKPEISEPAAVIGPQFARLCGDVDDVFTIMTGSRMFIITVARVREYLDTLELQEM